ncbi:TPA: hypothetical protein DEG75_02560 [Candidatus Dependentiae bacterium]|nr:hypothetical protein [Candidatus Dependentiae bacterium]
MRGILGLVLLAFPAIEAAEAAKNSKIKDAFEWVKDVVHLMTEKTDETTADQAIAPIDKKEEKPAPEKKQKKPSELLRAVSFAAGFVVPCYFAATSNIPLHRLGYHQLDRASQNCMLGIGSFFVLSSVHALVRATKMAYIFGKEDAGIANDKKKIVETFTGAQAFVNGEFAMARLLLEQLIHPVSIASCLGGGFKSPLALDMAHTILVRSLSGRENRWTAQGLIKSHHTGILTGAFAGLMFKHRAVIGDSIGRVVSNAIKVSSRVLARG